MINPSCSCKTKRATAALAKTVSFMRTVGDENRLRILCLLQEGERCVCEIWQHLDLPQNLTSHHLSVLKDRDLIRARKEGLKVFYSINEKIMAHHLHSLSHFLWRTHRS
ncbi:MAG: metalloregulator ArsR/SmtB family transcription factor [Candidatus Peribacteraceae bacterium]|nr:metalloregulator ArsR/SmtB family transcription factor [Candidatus Peribacteraceae bacterium]MDD5740007.1 metalloregulator ArsR/SmtB family transcription factor [Candidatus Peribacteraceae bacterium]